MSIRRFIEVSLSIFRIGTAWTIMLMLISGAAVIFTLTSGRHYTVFGYISYILSSYALTSFIVSIPKMYAEFTAFKDENKMVIKVKSFLYGNKYIGPIIMDVSLRVTISLYVSLFINLVYSGLRLFFAFYYVSFWLGSEALFYIILSGVHFVLLRNVRKNKGNIKQELRTYQFCGYLLFAMNVALTGIVYQTIYYSRGYKYPSLLIYAAAAYAFFCLTVSIVQIFKFRKYKSPLLSAVKVINFAKALVAMFSLQIAMFVSFNEDDKILERIMNSVTGGMICLSIFAMAVIMVVQSLEKLKNTKA